jgi:site-specific recombinase XerC
MAARHRPLSPRSAAYALNVLTALFRWLIEQRYVLANPFAGVKLKSHAPRAALDVSRGISEGEWLLIRTQVNGLEWSYGWSEPAAQRLRFVLDFGYLTGLRASELVGAKVQRSPTSAGMSTAITGCTYSARVASAVRSRCRRLPRDRGESYLILRTFLGTSRNTPAALGSAAASLCSWAPFETR